MLRHRLLRTALLLPWLAACSSFAALSVRDFGAVGDGSTDDTQAIQRAVLATRGEGASRELLFPTGTYRLTAPVFVPGEVALRGIGAVRLATAGDHDLLYIHGVRRVSITGLAFLGGKRHIRLQPDEDEFGTVHISACTFMQSSGFAVECMRLVDPESKTLILPCRAEETSPGGIPRLVPQDESKGVPTECRIKLSIERSTFAACTNVVSALCEMATVTACQVDTGEKMRGGAFRSSGRLLIDRLHGIAHPVQGRKQHWVTALGGSVILRRSTFETRESWGLCAVYALRTGTDIASSVTIDSCSFVAAGNEERCLVYCHQLPNLISVRDTMEITDQDVDILGFSKPYDREMLLPLRHYEQAALDERFCLDIGQGNRGLVANVPKALEALAANPLAEGTASEFRTTPYEIKDQAPEEPRSILNLRDFGAVGDGKADDSGPLEKALRKLRKDDMLLVPSGHYRLESTVKLPSRVRILGEGWPLFEAARPKMVGLEAKRVLAVEITGCCFTGGESALAITSAPDRETTVQLRQCVFLGTSGPAVSCLSGAGRAREPNRSTLRISDNEFRGCGQALQTNFDRSHLAGCLVMTAREANQQAVVDSMGSSMLVENLYGMPQVAAVGSTADPRWFDAYGRLLCRNVRFGRENGGMCLAFLKPGERGEVEAYVEDSETWCAGNQLRKAMIHCEVLPRLVIVRDCVADPTLLLTVSATEAVVSKLPSVVRTTANLFPVRLPEKE